MLGADYLFTKKRQACRNMPSIELLESMFESIANPEAESEVLKRASMGIRLIKVYSRRDREKRSGANS